MKAADFEKFANCLCCLYQMFNDRNFSFLHEYNRKRIVLLDQAGNDNLDSVKLILQKAMGIFTIPHIYA